MALYGAETWTLRAADQKYLGSSEMWSWRRMEKISWTDHVRNEEVLLRVNEKSNIIHEIRKRKANWIGHILGRNCLLKQVIEGKIKGETEATRRRWRRRKKLLDDLKDSRGYSHLKEEALVNEQRNILHEIRKRKANWIGHIVRRNCLLKQVIEGKIKGEMEVTRRRGRRRKKLLCDLKDRRGYSHLKEEALDRTMWRHRFGGGFGPVVRQNTEWMNAQCIVVLDWPLYRGPPVHFFLSNRDLARRYGENMKVAWKNLDRTEFIMTEDTNVSFLLLTGESWT